jgi:hypothetical protein
MDDPTNQSVARTYQSPWEKAMKGDESLTSTMRSKMAGPVAQKDLVHYKSFNRYSPSNPEKHKRNTSSCIRGNG